MICLYLNKYNNNYLTVYVKEFIFNMCISVPLKKDNREFCETKQPPLLYGGRNLNLSLKIWED